MHLCARFGLQRFLSAARNGNDKEVYSFLSTYGKALVNQKDGVGRTALMYASARGCYRVVSLLLSAGADVNVRDIYKRTVLMGACTYGSDQVVQMLLTAGADINAICEKGCTALMSASSAGHHSVVAILVAAGADVNIQDVDGTSALICASMRGHQEVVSLLLTAGARIHAEETDGSTALIWACKKGHFEVISFLLSAGADINAPDMEGKTPLDWARTDAIRALLLDYMSPSSEHGEVAVAPEDAEEFAALTRAHSSISDNLASGRLLTEKTPESFLCPITQEMMTDAVICADGHSYQRCAIQKWLISHNTSPLTNKILANKTLITNHALKSCIQEYLELKSQIETKLASPRHAQLTSPKE